MGRLLRFLVVLAGASALLVVSVLALAPQGRAALTAATAGSGTVDLAPLAQNSVVLAADGSVLGALHGEENRVPVELDGVPRHLVDAVLAIEDQDFWNHEGINLRAVGRAFVTNVQAGDVRQGGSTITQQLVKTSLLTPERDLERKLKEAVLAVQLEDQLSKEEILELYLNTVYFGNGAYGVESAARLYFGKPVSDLDPAESAFLAGMVRNPTGYDPFTFPEESGARRDLVVETLMSLGHVSPAQARAMKAAPIPTEAHTPLEPPRDYFLEEVKARLLEDPRLGHTPAERYNAVFKGGLTIKTTLDPALQALAAAAVRQTLPERGIEHTGRDGNPGRFTAALVSIDTETGAVRAVFSGEDFSRSQYRLATQGLRQPGSSFKPIILASALEHGFSPEDTINASGPCEFRSQQWLGPEPWEVGNYGDARGGGTMTLRSAMHRSLNCAFARLVLVLGPDKAQATARELGITSDVEALPGMALGTEEVRPIDMAGAFATFANDGVHHQPYMIEEVLDRDGNRLFSGRPKGTRAVSSRTARLMTDVLQGVVTGGTGTAARLPGWEVAGKTGTTQNYEDAWFVGATRVLTTSVWMGSPLGKVPMRSVGGIRVTGGSYPARIWRAFMAPALEGVDPVGFEEPEGRERGRALRLDRSIDRSATTTTTPRRRATTTTTTTTATSAPERAAPESERPAGEGQGGGGGAGGDSGGGQEEGGGDGGDD